MGPRLFRACPVVVLAGIASAQTTWHVDADAPAGDGTSWDSPFAFLQDALDAATDDDTILVAEGTYLPDRDAANPGGTGSRNATFQIQGVLLGGYAGYDAADPTERDPDAFVTILSGDLAANDAPDFANRTDNAYHVLTPAGIGAMVDGVTITAGYADQDVPQGRGAGALIDDDFEPMFVDCRFTDNAAAQGGAVFTSGGVTFADCRFDGNGATLDAGGANMSIGGAIAVESGSLILESCQFVANVAEDRGGAINMLVAEASIVSCVFDSNDAQHGGAILADIGSDASVHNSLFVANNGSLTGGGLRLSNGSQFDVGTCTFYDNTSNFGSAVFSNFNDNSTPLVANSIIIGNEDPSFFSPTTPIDVLYSCVEEGYDGPGNIDADPMLTDPEIGDFSLQPGSPCIDAGTNTKVPEPLLTDYYGGARLVDDPDTADTGVGPGPIVDMGIAEMQAGCYADFNGDGSLDVLDFVAFQLAWVDQDGAADCDDNGAFNILDFVCFQLAFDAGCP